jgi:serine/threonine-protein kinase
MMAGDKIGPFVIERELGSGAMGSVYLAQFTKEDGSTMPIALKIVALGLLGNDSALARFEREAAILKQLKHPNIVRLIATGRYRKTPFIAMEYVDGEPLDRMLTRRGRLTWETVVDYAKQLCEALQHAHEKGIIHRDLKPSNLMLTKEGILKLTDFGIAKDTDVTALTGMNSTIGTSAYMSPEQCKGDKFITNKSDLYSLGVVLYELLTGKKPFVAENTVDMFLKHVQEVPTRPAKLIHEIPVWLDNLVMFLLEKEKERRPLDAATVGRMLADIEEKVQSQMSAGEVAASSIRASRTLAGQTFTDEDKDAARALKGKKKKKKRTTGEPWYSQTWAKALPLIAGIVIVATAIGVGIKYAGSNGDGGNAGRGDSPAPILSLEEKKGREWEGVLNNRFRRGMFRQGEEGEINEVNEMIMKAHEREKNGQLKNARDLWAELKVLLDRVDDPRKSALLWIADKRIKDIQSIDAKKAEIAKKLDDDQINERPWSGSAGDPMTSARLAFRYDRFGDKALGRRTWENLSKDLEKKTEEWVLFLLARQEMGPDPNYKPGEAFQATITNLDQKILALQKMVEKTKGDQAGDKAFARDCRNACRDVIDLYDGEKETLVKQHVAKAKEWLMALSN